MRFLEARDKPVAFHGSIGIWPVCRREPGGARGIFRPPPKPQTGPFCFILRREGRMRRLVFVSPQIVQIAKVAGMLAIQKFSGNRKKNYSIVWSEKTGILGGRPETNMAKRQSPDSRTTQARKLRLLKTQGGQARGARPPSFLRAGRKAGVMGELGHPGNSRDIKSWGPPRVKPRSMGPGKKVACEPGKERPGLAIWAKARKEFWDGTTNLFWGCNKIYEIRLLAKSFSR